MARSRIMDSHRISTFLKDELGLTITEYAIAAGLIAATMLAAFNTLGLTINAIIGAVMAYL